MVQPEDSQKAVEKGMGGRSCVWLGIEYDWCSFSVSGFWHDCERSLIPFQYTMGFPLEGLTRTSRSRHHISPPHAKNWRSANTRYSALRRCRINRRGFRSTSSRGASRAPNRPQVANPMACMAGHRPGIVWPHLAASYGSFPAESVLTQTKH